MTNFEKVKKNLNLNQLEGTNNNFMRKFSPREMINWVTSGLDLAVKSESTMDLIVDTVKNASGKLFRVERVCDYDYTCRFVSEDYYFLANEGFLYLVSPVWWAEKGRRGCTVLVDADIDIDISGNIAIVEHDTPTGEVFYTLKVR